MTALELLPHVNAGLNATVASLLLAGFIAIRRGKRKLHPKLMLSAFGVGILFLIGYVLQVGLTGHKRFPGDDWVRTAFLAILLSHTALAVIVVPLVIRTIYLGLKERLEQHVPWARVTFAIWFYVAVTGVVIYAMNNHVRPH